ncbi:MAG: hypothetical protein AAF687_09375 [Pseudomonadota bacterium]
MKYASFFAYPLTAVVAAAGLSMATTAPATASDDAEQAEESTEMTKGEKRLAKLLEGRVAGEPQRCIRTLPNQRMQTIDNTAYVYGSGHTIYVQRTKNPERIDDTDALVSRRFNATQLCKMDIVNTIDPFVGFFTGAVFFEDFVPYTRVKDEG